MAIAMAPMMTQQTKGMKWSNLVCGCRAFRAKAVWVRLGRLGLGLGVERLGLKNGSAYNMTYKAA